ncbi:MAG: translation elongation factor G [Deltaproteobacteria bacterium GWB2_55_19]|nr:MAG: translation elongation factor G [Deltaproteobacteria bacterium GWB2_55_19]
MEIPLDKKRNISVIAHGGAGKTTLSEAILFNAKATEKLGRVDDDTSILDYEPEEHKRKITISAAIHHYDWGGCRVNVIDTPGYPDFLTETRDALRVAGGAVVILSAISGVKVQTEKIWEFADEFEVCRIAFVNKMDKERASFFRAVDDMERVLKVKGVPMQLPIGEADAFKGVIDLLSMKAYYYKDDSSGSFDIKDVPPALRKDAEKARETMVEAVVEADDALTEKYLNGEGISVDEIKQGVREGVLTRRFIPVYVGSALRNMGVNLLMDAINLSLPAPPDKGTIRGVLKGRNPKTGEELQREPDYNAPFSAFVFKTVIDPYTGKLSFFRVYSGVLHADSTVLNATRDAKEKISHLYLLEGKKIKEVGRASAGDIVAAAKLKDTLTGDTLSDAGSPVAFPPFPPVPTTLSYAIRPRTKADEDKVPSGMERLMEEDPAIEFRRDEQTNEFLLSGVGQVHLEVSIEKLRRKYGCDVELKTPRVPYKETIRSHVKIQGKYKKQSGGRGQYGDAWLDLSPLPRGKGFEFVDNITGGSIPRQYIPAVEKGVREAMGSGILSGFPVVDVRVALYDGSYHSVDSSEMAFKIAASMGFKKGMEQAHPVILEPVVRMEISVPEDKLGDIIGDINARRGKILGAEPKAGSQTIKALVPMAEVITYATDLKAMTADRGIFTMEFSHYEEVPTYLSQKIIADAKAEKPDETR